MISVFLILLSQVFLQTPVFAHTDDPSAIVLSEEIEKYRHKVFEFEEISQKAKDLGIRVWLLADSASLFSQYVRWDYLRLHGDKEFQAEWFDHDLMTIFSSKLDLNLAVDGPKKNTVEFETWLRKEFPYVSTETNESRWKTHDFSKLADSQSKRLIELSDSKNPPANAMLLEEMARGELRFYDSSNTKTNADIIPVVQFLIEAFQADLKIMAEDQIKIVAIIRDFDPKSIDAETQHWLELNGPKLFKNAIDVVYAWNTLEELKLREKLLIASEDKFPRDGSRPYRDGQFDPYGVERGDFDADRYELRAQKGSLRWWMLKKPLIGEIEPIGQEREPSMLYAHRGGTQPKFVTHSTRDFESYESVTRSPKGIPNFFISRAPGLGEEASDGPGLYTRSGNDVGENSGARFFHVRLKVSRSASVRFDYVHTLLRDARDIIWWGRGKLRVVRENVGTSPEELIATINDPQNAHDFSRLELAKRKLDRHLLNPKTKNHVQKLIHTEDTVALGEAVVKGLAAYKSSRQTTTEAFEAEAEKADVVIAAPVSRLHMMAEHGILNLFQTAQSNGTPNFKKRIEADQALAELRDLQWHPASLHPKSGFLALGGIEHYTKFQRQYGNMLLKLKKEVDARTTFTMDDSLEFPLSHPKFALAAFLQKYPDFVSDKRHSMTFFEAQVWGTLTLSDVAAVYVEKSAYEEQKATLSLAQSLYGFEVYTFTPIGKLGYSLSEIQKVMNGHVSLQKPRVLSNVTQLETRYMKTFDLAERLIIISRLGEIANDESRALLEKILSSHGETPKKELEILWAQNALTAEKQGTQLRSLICERLLRGKNK